MRWAIVIAALVFPPFEQPGDDERAAAVGDVSALGAEVQQALDPHGEDFRPVPEPEEGDWLEQRQELGQTFGEFARSRRHLPVPGRRTIYLLPLEPAAGLEKAAPYLSRFLRFRVKVLPVLELAGELAPPERRGWKGQRQIDVVGLADRLRGRVPADAYCLIAVTGTDLFRHHDKAYTYGYSRPLERVAIVGTSRFGDGDPIAARRRFLATLSHEAGHLIGLNHCIYYACLMNGSNSVRESDARPLHLCPVCLRKLVATVRFSPAGRYHDLEQSLRARGLEADADWMRRRRSRLGPFR